MICRLFTHKVTAIPIFLAVMACVFYITFNTAGRLLENMLSFCVDGAAEALSTILSRLDAPPLLTSLLIDGIWAGVGSVLSFIPVIATLFFLLSLLEESGYLSSVAAILDGPMSRVGLSGRCVVPMISGFGCSVPAVLAAASISDKRTRLITVSLIPFMSCSAKLPIYSMFAVAFFDSYRLLAIICVYVIGIIAALICGLTAKYLCPVPGHCQRHPAVCRYHSPGSCSTPSRSLLRIPDMRIVTSAAVSSAAGFVKKAFTVILAASAIIWFLRSFDTAFQFSPDGSNSLLACLGKTVAPLLAPLGFEDWRAAAAIIAGLSAKEAVISTFAVLSSSGSPTDGFSAGLYDNSAALSQILLHTFTPPAALSFMVFCLLYAPCVATLSAVKSHAGGAKQAIAMFCINTAAAWVIAFAVYRIGLLICHIST